MRVIRLFKRSDGSVGEWVSEAELTALATRYAVALLREVEQSVAGVSIELQGERDDPQP
ncbi:MAG: hypothetical protein ACM3WT_02255 [Bacillota bacterium]